MILINNELYTPTIFPDGTPQAWKLPEHLYKATKIEIIWKYEDLTEFWSVMQIGMLIREARGNMVGSLVIYYLPFARQDAEVKNDKCFGLKVFHDAWWSVRNYFSRVYIVDPHCDFKKFRDGNLGVNWTPIAQNFAQHDIDVPGRVVFADESAHKKYSQIYQDKVSKLVRFYKKRDAQSGLLTMDMKINHDVDMCADITFVDDICDGGSTFIHALDMLKSACPTSTKFHLRTTYGIYSRGLQPLLDAGFTSINCIWCIDQVQSEELTEHLSKIYGEGYDIVL